MTQQVPVPGQFVKAIDIEGCADENPVLESNDHRTESERSGVVIEVATGFMVVLDWLGREWRCHITPRSWCLLMESEFHSDIRAELADRYAEYLESPAARLNEMNR